MMKFETLTGETLIRLKPYFSLRPTGCAESHLAYHLLWRPYYETKYFADDKGILWLQKIDYDALATMVPVCRIEHMRENFLRLQEHFTETGVRMHMYLVDEEALAAIDPDPAQYEVVEDRDSFDYIYSGEEMRLLPGRKYSKMKNRIYGYAIPQLYFVSDSLDFRRVNTAPRVCDWMYCVHAWRSITQW